MEKIASTSRPGKILAVIFLLTLTGMTGLFAIDITLKAPQIENPGNDPYIAEIQNEIDSIFRDIRDDFQRDYGNLNANPQKLIGAFATSSIFSSTGASLRSYQGYKTFALTVGAVGGVQLPLNIFSMFGSIADIEKELDKVENDLYNDGDLQLGMNPQILNAQLGINLGFLLKGLYLGFKGGYMSIPTLDLGGFQLSFQTFSAGALINYQLIRQFSLGGVFVWRGLNIGAGFIYQNTSLDLNMLLDDLTSDPVSTPYGVITGAVTDPKFHFGFHVKTYTVPLEAVTSIRLLGFLNASLGAGVDLGFGSASLGGDLDGGVNIIGYNQGVRPGSFSVSLGGSSTPNMFNPKVMTSVGISLGPVILLDIPVTYYFLNNGYNVGISMGLAF